MLIQKILRQHHRRFQLVAASLAASLGIGLMLLAVQIHFDFSRILGGGRSDAKSANLVSVNKPVTLANTLIASGFRAEEIENLRKQPFVADLTTFTNANFKVSASSAAMRFYTEMFLESVETAYLDAPTSRFTWVEGATNVPLILPRDYLALYNFGFAASQGLPQFSEETIGNFPFDLTVRNDAGENQTFRGQIVGFSDQINSILVPKNFMDWANNRYGTDRARARTARLLLRIKNGQDEVFKAFAKDNELEISNSRLSQFAPMVYSLLTVMVVLAVVLIGLAMFIFVLNYQLLVERSSHEIRLLLQTGYAPRQIEGVLRRSFLGWFGVVLGLTVVILGISRWIWVELLRQQGFQIGFGFNIWVWILGGVIFFVLWWVNWQNIRQSVLRQAK